MVHSRIYPTVPEKDDFLKDRSKRKTERYVKLKRLFGVHQ